MAAATAPKTVQQIKRLMPLFNRVVIKRDDMISQTKGGIVLPDNRRKRSMRGVVVAIGPGERTDSGGHLAVPVQPGDEVLLPEYNGTKVEMDNEIYYIYKDTELLGKFD